MTRPMRIREDVHLHASAPAVRQRILDLSTYDEWLAPAFREVRADDEGWSYTLTLAGRTEQGRLRRGGIEDGAVAFVRDGAGSIGSMTWALHAESPREVHLTVEVTYAPAGGLAGHVLEVILYRPHRVQALRDSLWALKQIMEQR